jgi:hypothetical protein
LAISGKIDYQRLVLRRPEYALDRWPSRPVWIGDRASFRRGDVERHPVEVLRPSLIV